MTEQSYLENIASDELSPEELYTKLFEQSAEVVTYFHYSYMLKGDPLELRCFSLLWDGYNNTQIAHQLGRSRSFVQKLKKRIMQRIKKFLSRGFIRHGE